MSDGSAAVVEKNLEAIKQRVYTALGTQSMIKMVIITTELWLIDMMVKDLKKAAVLKEKTKKGNWISWDKVFDYFKWGLYRIAWAAIQVLRSPKVWLVIIKSFDAAKRVMCNSAKILLYQKLQVLSASHTRVITSSMRTEATEKAMIETIGQAPSVLSEAVHGGASKAIVGMSLVARAASGSIDTIINVADSTTTAGVSALANLGKSVESTADQAAAIMDATAPGGLTGMAQKVAVTTAGGVIGAQTGVPGAGLIVPAAMAGAEAVKRTAGQRIAGAILKGSAQPLFKLAQKADGNMGVTAMLLDMIKTAVYDSVQEFLAKTLWMELANSTYSLFFDFNCFKTPPQINHATKVTSRFIANLDPNSAITAGPYRYSINKIPDGYDVCMYAEREQSDVHSVLIVLKGAHTAEITPYCVSIGTTKHPLGGWVRMNCQGLVDHESLFDDKNYLTGKIKIHQYQEDTKTWKISEAYNQHGMYIRDAIGCTVEDIQTPTRLGPDECVRLLQGFADALAPDSGWKRVSPGFLRDPSIPSKDREVEDQMLNELHKTLMNQLQIRIHKHAFGLDNSCMAGGCWVRNKVYVWINPVRIYDCSRQIHEQSNKEGDDALKERNAEKTRLSKLHNSPSEIEYRRRLDEQARKVVEAEPYKKQLMIISEEDDEEKNVKPSRVDAAHSQSPSPPETANEARRRSLKKLHKNVGVEFDPGSGIADDDNNEADDDNNEADINADEADDGNNEADDDNNEADINTDEADINADEADDGNNEADDDNNDADDDDNDKGTANNDAADDDEYDPEEHYTETIREFYELFGVVDQSTRQTDTIKGVQPSKSVQEHLRAIPDNGYVVIRSFLQDWNKYPRHAALLSRIVTLKKPAYASDSGYLVDNQEVDWDMGGIGQGGEYQIVFFNIETGSITIHGPVKNKEIPNSDEAIYHSFRLKTSQIILMQYMLNDKLVEVLVSADEFPILKHICENNYLEHAIMKHCLEVKEWYPDLSHMTFGKLETEISPDTLQTPFLLTGVTCGFIYTDRSGNISLKYSPQEADIALGWHEFMVAEIPNTESPSGQDVQFWANNKSSKHIRTLQERLGIRKDKAKDIIIPLCPWHTKASQKYLSCDTESIFKYQPNDKIFDVNNHRTGKIVQNAQSNDAYVVQYDTEPHESVQLSHGDMWPAKQYYSYPPLRSRRFLKRDEASIVSGWTDTGTVISKPQHRVLATKDEYFSSPADRFASGIHNGGTPTVVNTSSQELIIRTIGRCSQHAMHVSLTDTSKAQLKEKNQKDTPTIEFSEDQHAINNPWLPLQLRAVRPDHIGWIVCEEEPGIPEPETLAQSVSTSTYQRVRREWNNARKSWGRRRTRYHEDDPLEEELFGMRFGDVDDKTRQFNTPLEQRHDNFAGPWVSTNKLPLTYESYENRRTWYTITSVPDGYSTITATSSVQQAQRFGNTHYNITEVSTGQKLYTVIDQEERRTRLFKAGQLTWKRAVELLTAKEDEGISFRNDLTETICGGMYDYDPNGAVYFECFPYENDDSPFEFVLIDAANDLDEPADPSDYKKKFRTTSQNNEIRHFQSKSENCLISPEPTKWEWDYKWWPKWAHIVSFLKNAKNDDPKSLQLHDELKHSLWKAVGERIKVLRKHNIKNGIENTVWLSTDGRSVPWLHVRVSIKTDKKKLHYKYTPFLKHRQAQTKKRPQVEPKAPAPAVQKAPAPAVPKAPAPAVQKAPAPSLQKAPAPAVQKAPAPAVQKAPAPTVQKQKLYWIYLHSADNKNAGTRAAVTLVLHGSAGMTGLVELDITDMHRSNYVSSFNVQLNDLGHLTSIEIVVDGSETTPWHDNDLYIKNIIVHEDKGKVFKWVEAKTVKIENFRGNDYRGKDFNLSEVGPDVVLDIIREGSSQWAPEATQELSKVAESLPVYTGEHIDSSPPSTSAPSQSQETGSAGQVEHRARAITMKGASLLNGMVGKDSTTLAIDKLTVEFKPFTRFATSAGGTLTDTLGGIYRGTSSDTITPWSYHCSPLFEVYGTSNSDQRREYYFSWHPLFKDKPVFRESIMSPISMNAAIFTSIDEVTSKLKEFAETPQSKRNLNMDKDKIQIDTNQISTILREVVYPAHLEVVPVPAPMSLMTEFCNPQFNRLTKNEPNFEEVEPPLIGRAFNLEANRGSEEDKTNGIEHTHPSMRHMYIACPTIIAKNGQKIHPGEYTFNGYGDLVGQFTTPVHFEVPLLKLTDQTIRQIHSKAIAQCTTLSKPIRDPAALLAIGKGTILPRSQWGDTLQHQIPYWRAYSDIDDLWSVTKLASWILHMPADKKTFDARAEKHKQQKSDAEKQEIAELKEQKARKEEEAQEQKVQQAKQLNDFVKIMEGKTYPYTQKSYKEQKARKEKEAQEQKVQQAKQLNDFVKIMEGKTYPYTQKSYKEQKARKEKEAQEQKVQQAKQFDDFANTMEGGRRLKRFIEEKDKKTAERTKASSFEFGEAQLEYSDLSKEQIETWMVAIKKVTTDMESNQRNYLQQLIQEFTPIEYVRTYFSTSWPETLFQMLTFEEEDTKTELNHRFMEIQSKILQDQSCNMSQFCIPQVAFTPNIFLQMTDKHPTDQHQPHKGFWLQHKGMFNTFKDFFGFRHNLRKNFYIRPMYCDTATTQRATINSHTLQNLKVLQKQASKGDLGNAWVTSPRVNSPDLQRQPNVRPYHWTSCLTQPDLLYMIPMIGDMPTRRPRNVEISEMVSNNKPGNRERWQQRRLKTFDNYDNAFTVQLTNYNIGDHTFQASLFRSIRSFKSWIFNDVVPCRMKTNDLLWVFKGRNHEHEGTLYNGQLKLKPRHSYDPADMYNQDPAKYDGLSDTCTIQAHFGFFKLRENQEFLVKDLYHFEAPLDDYNVSGNFTVIVLLVDGIRVPIFCESGSQTQIKENGNEGYVAGMMAALGLSEIKNYAAGQGDGYKGPLPDQQWYHDALSYTSTASNVKDLYDMVAKSTLTQQPAEALKEGAQMVKDGADTAQAAKDTLSAAAEGLEIAKEGLNKAKDGLETAKGVGDAAKAMDKADDLLKTAQASTEALSSPTVSDIGKEVSKKITQSETRKLVELGVNSADDVADAVKGGSQIIELGETALNVGTNAATVAPGLMTTIKGKIGSVAGKGVMAVKGAGMWSLAAVALLTGAAAMGISYLKTGSLLDLYVSFAATSMHAYAFTDTYGNTFDQLTPQHMRKAWLEFWHNAISWYPTQVSKPTVRVVRQKGRITLAIKRNGEILHTLDPLYTHPLEDDDKIQNKEPNTSPYFVNDCIIRSAYSSDFLILLVKTGEEILKHLYVRRTCQILAGWLPTDDNTRSAGIVDKTKANINHLLKRIIGPVQNPFDIHQKPYPDIENKEEQIISKDFIQVLEESGFQINNWELLKRDLRKVLKDQKHDRTKRDISKEMLETAQSTALSDIEDEVAHLFSFRDQNSTLSQEAAKAINKVITDLIMTPVYLNESFNKETQEHEHWGHTAADVLSSICRSDKIQAGLETNVFDDAQPAKTLPRMHIFNDFQRKPAKKGLITQMADYINPANTDSKYEPVSKIEIFEDEFSEETVNLSQYSDKTIHVIYKAQLDILKAMIYTVTPPVQDTNEIESIPWFAWACEYFTIVRKNNTEQPRQADPKFGNITI